MKRTGKFDLRLSLGAFVPIIILTEVFLFVALTTMNTSQGSPNSKQFDESVWKDALNKHDGANKLKFAASAANERSTCANYQISAEKFLDGLKMIAVHGTLTDIEFIERSLDTRFQSEVAIESGGENKDRKIYESESVFGAPAKLSLDVLSDRKLQVERGGIAFMRIEVGCPDITKAQLERWFGDEFLFHLATDGAPIMSGSKQLRLSKSGKSDLYLGYSSPLGEEGRVLGIILSEEPRKAKAQ